MTFFKSLRFISLFVLLFMGVISCQQKVVQEEKPLNFVFILSDDHAYQAISAYSDQLIQTPNIDRIANAGIRFDDAFVTNSICSPSRATLLTGKMSHKNGQKTNHDTFNGSQVTIPKLMQQAGYQTAIVGKWHLKSLPTGFDYWNVLPEQGYYYNPDFNKMGDTIQVTGYATDIITHDAVDWLNHRDAKKPFYLMINHKAPHRNWMPPLRYLDSLKNKEFAVPETFNDTYEGRLAAPSQWMHLGKNFLTWYDSKATSVATTQRDSILWDLVYTNRLTDSEKEVWSKKYANDNERYKKGLEEGKSVQYLNYQAYMRDYLRTVMALDENIGKVLDYLESEGLVENTVIVYGSDQGMYLGEHAWFDKRWMYEESMRMPLLMMIPKTEKGVVNKDIIMNIDLVPTLLDYANIDIPKDIQGRSFKNLVEGKPLNAPWREAAYYHYYEYPIMTHVNPHYGIRTKDYKLIRFYGDIDSWELFDLKNDPTEVHNVYGDPKFKEITEDLKKQLSDLRIQYDDLE